MKSRRILFLAEGQLGDLLLLTPALRGVKASFPGCTLAVLVVERRGGRMLDPRNPVAGPLPRDADVVLAGNPSVDLLYALNRDALRTLPLFQRIRAEFRIVTFLRRQNFDTVISTFPEDRFALWAWASGADVRVGQQQQGLRFLFTVRPGILKRDRGVLQYYCELARSCGASSSSLETEYVVSAGARAWANEALAAVGVREGEHPVIVHPGATGDYKIWPPDRYAELLDRLQEENVRVILCHGPLDTPVVERIRQRARRSFTVIPTGNHVARLAALLERGALCISNDSGPRHLAVALGLPTLSFFRLHHDREWLAYDETPARVVLRPAGPCPACPSGECHDLIPEHAGFGSFCLRMISVDDAIAAVRRMLA